MLAFLPAFVFAYDPHATHNALTDEIVDFYNYSYPSKKLTSGERALIKRGSIEEDEPDVRVLNHFYDPIRNVGLKSINNTSKAWAMNAGLQSNNDQFAGTGGLLLDTFTSPTDFSWERAIFDYAYKDKERGLLALGHILHLIEDATVPDHVRDDAHPPAFSFGSPYEAYTSQYTENTIETFTQLVRERVRPVELSSIGEYFDTVATFTNTNFFSKDTIFDEKYVRPNYLSTESKILSDKALHIFGISDNGIKLLMITPIFDENTGLVINNYSIQDPDNLILSDYWQILSRTAVKNGAGIIKLFFDEVEKEKKTGTLLAKNKSMWSKLIDKTTDSVKAIFSATASSTASNNLASVASLPSGGATQTPSTTVSSSQSSPQASNPTLSTQTQSSQIQTKTPVTQTNPPTPAPPVTPPPTVVPPLIAISPGFGGGSTIVPTTASDSSSVDADSIATTAFSTTDATSTISYISILSPQQNAQISATSTIIFSGTSTPSSIVGLDLALATTTTNTDGNWQIPLTLSQGTTTLVFYSADPQGTRATSTASVSVYLDNTAPVFNFAVPLCAESLALDGCVITTTVVPISLSPSSDDFSHFTLAIDGIYSTTTTATTTIMANDVVHTIEVSAIDLLGNQSATSTQTLFTSTFPMVINEVAWAGSQASTTAEWIELYNKTPYTISLTNWTLYAESLRPYISLTGTIGPRDFYLLERRDDTAVNTVTADQIYGNGGSTWALSNTGDRLILSYASTTMDQTALTYETSDAGFWAGGDNQSDTKISMERYDAYVVGDDEFNWDSNLGIVKNGNDVAGNLIYGTPRARNSLSYLINKNQDLEGDITLTLANSPYLVVDTFLDIPEGHTLTIEPGVVVKFREGGFDFEGRLISLGTQDQPVVFTSFTDDRYGGDLNGDSTLTTPSYRDWSGISFASGASGSIIDGLKVFYSEGLYVNRASLSGSYVEIANTERPVYMDNGSTITLSHALLQNNTGDVFELSGSTGTFTDLTILGTTTTGQGFVVAGGSSVNIEDFTISNMVLYDVFAVYIDSALRLRNGTISSVVSSVVNVFLRSSVDMDAVTIDLSDGRSGGDVISVYGGSYATTTRVTIEGSREAAFSAYGHASLGYPTVYIASSTFSNNEYGAYLSDTGPVVIEGTEITSGEYGIISDRSPLVIRNSSIVGTEDKALWNFGDIVVSALNNWWGDATGPEHATLNSDGLGGVIVGGVDFDPWLTSDPFHPSPPTPFVEEF